MVLADLSDTSGEQPTSRGSISILSGRGVTVGETDVAFETMPEVELQLSPDSPVVIGRRHGRGTPYLDPAYSSTNLVPGTFKNVLHSGGEGDDLFVSRAHFMLRHAAGGILLVNGVPRVGGGIRPPMNGTRLQAPSSRELDAGEEYLIETGTSVVLRLPNGTEIEIDSR